MLIKDKISFIKQSATFILAMFVVIGIIIAIPTKAYGSYMAFDEIGHEPTDFTVADMNNGGSIGAVGFHTPIGIAMDTIHHWLFVAEADNNRVVVFNLDSNNELIDHTADYVLGQRSFETGTPHFVGNSGFHYPDVITYDEIHSRLFVSDGLNNRVMVFDFSSGIITNGVDADYILGTPSLPTDANILYSQNDMAYDKTNDRLYVADTLNNRVLVFDVRPEGSASQSLCGVSSTGIESGMDASCVLGQPDMASRNFTGETTAEKLNTPIALLLDEQSSLLYVSDNTDNRILIYNVSNLSNGMPAINVLGAPDFNTRYSSPYIDPGITNWNFNDPRGMMLDSENKILFVSDANFHRVLGFDVASITNGESAISVLGQPDFVTADLNTSQGGFQNVQWSLWIPDKRVQYIVDAHNNRVMLFKFISLDTISIANGEVGVEYSNSLTTSNSQGTVFFELVSGDLPAGLTLGANGLTGIPTLAGTYSFTVWALDNIGTSSNAFYSNQRSYSMIIAGVGGSGGGEDEQSIFICSDNLDNDSDSFIDEEDPGCHSDGDAENLNSYNPFGTDEFNALPPIDVYNCSDSNDNDSDGLVDINDPDCHTDGDAQNTLSYDENRNEVTAPPVSGGSSSSHTSRSESRSTSSTPLPDFSQITNNEIIGSVLGVFTENSTNNSNEDLSNLPFLQDGPVSPISNNLDESEKAPSSQKINNKDLVFMIITILAGPLLGWFIFICFFRAKIVGVVFDSKKENPLSGVSVILYNKLDKKLKKLTTNIDGKYKFRVNSGKYRIFVQKSNYSFPSRLVAVENQSVKYKDAYLGDYFEVETVQTKVVKNIPLDSDHTI